MSYILQSNVAVADPTGKFPVVTPFGVADPDLGRFFYAQKAAGLLMSEAHYNAFKTFIDALKAGGVWASVKEIYPLYGTSLAGIATKLRQQYSAGPMVAQNGLALGDFALDGAGISLGAAAGRAYQNDNARSFNTLVTGAQIASGFGFNVYADATMPYVANQIERNLWGAYLGASGGFQILASARVIAADNRTLRVMNTGNANLESGAVASPKGLMRFEGKANGAIYLDGVSLVSGPVPAGSTGGLTKQLSLLAKTPADGSTVTQGFNGAVRFVSIDDGTLDDTKRGVLRTATMALMAALGRTFT